MRAKEGRHVEGATIAAHRGAAVGASAGRGCHRDLLRQRLRADVGDRNAVGRGGGGADEIEAVVSPPGLHKYIEPPAAVSEVLLPWQMVLALALKLGAGV